MIRDQWLAFGVALDDMADIAQGGTGFYDVDGLVKAFLGDLHKAFVMGFGPADEKHGAGIAVEVILDDRDNPLCHMQEAKELAREFEQEGV